MQNAIVFKDGSFVWITAGEKALISYNILNGEAFFELERLNTTYSSDSVAYVGIYKMFFAPLVQGALFGFTSAKLFAQSGNSYWETNGPEGWISSTKENFENSSDFDGFIKDNTVPVTA
jgi:hypothetical protein